MGSSLSQKVVVHEVSHILVTTMILTSKTDTELNLQKLRFQSSAKDYCLALIKTFAFSVSWFLIYKQGLKHFPCLERVTNH